MSGMLWADDNIQLPNNYFSSLVQLKSLEKRLSRDTRLNKNYANTIREDFKKVTQLQSLMLTRSSSGRIKSGTYHIP